jgi:hypothetical protein
VQPQFDDEEVVVVVPVVVLPEDEEEVVVTVVPVTERENVPELAALLVSPLYDAVMVTWEADDEEGVYVRLHVAFELTQEPTKVPELELEKESEPVGLFPLRVAVQVVGLPTWTLAGEHVTETEVA